MRTFFEDVFHNWQRRKRIWPTDVEGQMHDYLCGLCLCQVVVHRPIEMVRNLRNLAVSNQRADSHEAPISRRKVRTQPQILETERQ